MKNAKKLLLLLLSLVLLVGVFAVAVLAEEEPSAATVTYPDGTVDTYTAAGAITPSIETKDGLYNGKGNTLYKDNSGAGWIYTDAAGNAVTEITEEMIAAGAKITASGLDKVYSVIEAALREGDYWKWLSGESSSAVKFVQAGASYENGNGETVQSVKRAAGNYTLYFYDEASLINFFSQNASIEIGGVLLSYQDLRWNATYRAKIYADHVNNTVNLFDWEKNGFDRPANKDLSGQGGTTGGQATIYFDLNGHTLTSSYMVIPNSANVCFYSSVAGAHFFSKSSNAFYVSDDATLYLGSDSASANTKIKDYLNVHAKSLFQYLDSGSGVYLYGGNYYQTEATTTALISSTGRLNAVQNASFYVKDGVNVFHNVPDATVSGCSFYTNGSSAILGGSSGKELKLQSCNFYGVSTEVDASVGTVNLISGNNSFDPVTYNTVRWLDGTTDYYYAKNHEEAKTFVEGIAKIKIAPYAYEKDGGLFYIASSAPILEYDAAFNVVQKETAEGEKVYFAYETNNKITYVTDAENCGTQLAALLAALPKDGSTTVTLYSDISMPGTAINGRKAYEYRLDINGYTLTITSVESAEKFAALEVHATKFYLYSSRPNGVIKASVSERFIHTDNSTYGGDSISSTTYIGGNSTQYNGNLTVICRMINPDMHGSGIYLLGTTFIQAEGTASSYFFRLSRQSTGADHIKQVKDCTFIITNAATGVLHYRSTRTVSFENCNFVCTADSGAPLFWSGNTVHTTNPNFKNCNFYNILPAKNHGDQAISYDTNCSFGFSTFAPAQDIDLAEETAMYLVRGAAEKTIVANGVSYVLNTALSADPGVLVTFKDDQNVFGSERWLVNATIEFPASFFQKIDIENECIWRNPSYNPIADETGITANITWGYKDPWAIAYTAGSVTTYVSMSDCGNTEEGVGNMFYDLFNAPLSSYVIKMYADMTLSKGVPFGKGDSGGSRVHYSSLANGDITLDLNGHILTISENMVPVCPSNSNTYHTSTKAVFCFEGQAGKTFTLTSSKADAKIINPTTFILFSVGEQDRNHITIDGENITITSYGGIIGFVEPNTGIKVTVDGGTYIYTGTSAAFSLAGTVSFKNATVVAENEKAGAVFAAPNYAYTSTYAFENVRVYAVGRPNLFGFTIQSSYALTDNQNRSSTFTLNFTNCVLAGVNLTKTYKNTTVNYSGSLAVASTVDLSATIPTPPADACIAFTSDTIGGYAVKLLGYYAEKETAVVDWGFGLDSERWAIGATAMHENAIVDDLFGYTFEALKVTDGKNVAKATLVAIHPNAMKMSLTLQSQIGMNLMLNPAALEGATVTFNGETYVLADLEKVNGIYVLKTAIKPNEANRPITLAIEINGNTHTIPVSVGTYAEAVLTSEDAEIAKAKNLTYAMVEYVRAMIGDADYLKDAPKPAGYDDAIKLPEQGEGTGETGNYIAFCLDDTIAIAVQSTSTDVVLKLPSGRVLNDPDVIDNAAIFAPLAVNELAADFTVVIGEASYTYSLEDYYYALKNSTDEAIAVKAPIVAALYNYSQQAFEYAREYK